MHGNKENGTLEEWNIGRMGFSKKLSIYQPSFHYFTIPLLRRHR